VPQDEVKFVICNREDFIWSVEIIDQYQLYDRVDNILFSPVFDVEGVFQRQDDFNEQLLAQWILDSGLPVRMQIQMHKLIWGDESGR
jgi:7-carboxy-7-deazaguanine synthase